MTHQCQLPKPSRRRENKPYVCGCGQAWQVSVICHQYQAFPDRAWVRQPPSTIPAAAGDGLLAP